LINAQLGPHGKAPQTGAFCFPAGNAPETVAAKWPQPKGPGERAERSRRCHKPGPRREYARTTQPAGKPQSRRNALRAVHLAGDAAGLNGEGLEPVGLHDLRHSMVAIAFELGLTEPEVAVLARHANAKVTLTVYAGLTDGGRERASTKLAEGGFGA
jgi:integrase